MPCPSAYNRFGRSGRVAAGRPEERPPAAYDAAVTNGAVCRGASARSHPPERPGSHGGSAHSTKADLETLRVLATLPDLDPDDPAIQAVKRASEPDVQAHPQGPSPRGAPPRHREHDGAIIALTATGSPLRIDDETRASCYGSRPSAPPSGSWSRPRLLHLQGGLPGGRCLLPLALPGLRRNQSRQAQPAHRPDRQTCLLTGGAPRSGCTSRSCSCATVPTLTITTRFPRDAVRRFTAQEDNAQWIDRLKIVGGRPARSHQVVALADEGRRRRPRHPHHNACQTVRRPPGASPHLVDGESAPLPAAYHCLSW